MSVQRPCGAPIVELNQATCSPAGLLRGGVQRLVLRGLFYARRCFRDRASSEAASRVGFLGAWSWPTKHERRHAPVGFGEHMPEDDARRVGGFGAKGHPFRWCSGGDGRGCGRPALLLPDGRRCKFHGGSNPPSRFAGDRRTGPSRRNERQRGATSRRR